MQFRAYNKTFYAYRNLISCERSRLVISSRFPGGAHMAAGWLRASVLGSADE